MMMKKFLLAEFQGMREMESVMKVSYKFAAVSCLFFVLLLRDRT